MDRANRKQDARRQMPRSSSKSNSGNARSRQRPTGTNSLHEEYRRQILQAVDPEIEPVDVSGSYRFALLAVAAAMVLLPLGYIALVLLAGFGVIWHAISNTWMISVSSWGFLFYLLPVVCGPFVVLFLVKPLFAESLAHQRPRAVKRDAEPFLYDYVEAICESVGAPAPASIRVNSDVNASASFRRGFASIFSNDLTLTIGLPLAYGLTVRQLSGVLAHEFGHFAQGTGLRLNYFIRHINFWFLRAVYERDSWDEWMFYRSQGNGIVAYGLKVARLAVWGSRAILWCLMLAGNAISCFLTRQMEFDADRYEARLAGSKSFAQTQRRMTALTVAEQFAIRDLRYFYEEGRLVDDLPRLISANVDQITPELKDAIREYEESATTHVFDTHPSNQERIESAIEEDSEGIFHVPEKLERLRATILFKDINRVSRWASLQFYKEVIGPELKSDSLQPVDDMIERRDAEIESAKSLHRYFQIRMPAFYPFPISTNDGDESRAPKEIARKVRDARKAMLGELDEYKELTERFELAESSQMESAAAMTLLDAGVDIKGKDFGMLDNTRKTAKFRHRNAQKGTEHLASLMLEFEEAAGKRLSASLDLLKLDACVSQIENGDAMRDEVQELVPHAKLISNLVAELPTLRILCHRMVVLLAHLDGRAHYQDFYETLIDTFEKVHGRLEALYRSIGLKPYPLDHIEEHMTLRDFVLPEVPDPQDFTGMYHVSMAACDRLVALQMRLFARLTLAAEKVEAAIGLEPLPDPENEDKNQETRQRSSKRGSRSRNNAV